MIKFCFACLFTAIIIASLFTSTTRESFLPKLPKKMATKTKQTFHKHRRKLKNRINKHYENLTNKFTAVKIKYL